MHIGRMSLYALYSFWWLCLCMYEHAFLLLLFTGQCCISCLVASGLKNWDWLSIQIFSDQELQNCSWCCINCCATLFQPSFVIYNNLITRYFILCGGTLEFVYVTPKVKNSLNKDCHEYWPRVCHRTSVFLCQCIPVITIYWGVKFFYGNHLSFLFVNGGYQFFLWILVVHD